MDVHVIYFDESKQKVVRSYIGSSFMGHFKDVHGDLDLTLRFPWMAQMLIGKP